ncbi:extracellular solute-binding protein [Anaerococcus cruorum]|uniref:extracellular solute-binding protein n=1 Tax=Anaerococcus sp. WGS1596 TaxID=3366806 RepID=UPI00372D08B6
MNKKIFLTAAMALSLAACGNNADSPKDEAANNAPKSSVEVNKEGYPIVDEKITMTMVAPGLGINEWNDMDFIKDYEEKTNVHMDITTPPQSEFKTKLNLDFASGDIPDVIYAGGPNTLNAAAEVDYGSQGLLAPLEDLIPEYAPNFNKLMEENPEIKKSITTTDGHIYAIPHINEGPTSKWIMGPVWYNGEWLDNLGVKDLPKTTDEFYDLMVRFKNEDPNGNGEADEIPISDVNFGGIRHWFMPAFGLKGWGVQVNNDKVSYSFTDPGFRGYLEFMHKLYAEGLIDQEIFSQSKEQLQAKGQDDRLGVFQEWYSYFITGRDESEAINDPMFAPLTSEYQKEPVMPIVTGIKRGSFAISSKNPSPEAALRWIDTFYTKDGFDYLYYGPEGSYWVWNDDKTVKEYSDAAKNSDDPEKYRGYVTPAYGITVPAYSVPLDPIGGETDSSFNDFIEKETKEKILDNGEIIFPLTYLTNEENEEVSDITVELETYMKENEAQFINGTKELNDETWQEYLDTMNKIGAERLIKIYQAAYDRWKAID